MKAQMFYAPVLLLSLSMACGKADKQKEVKAEAMDKVVQAAALIEATAASHPVTADVVTPAPSASNNVIAPVVNAPVAVAPAANAPVVNAPAVVEEVAPVAQPAESSDEATERAAGISTGVKAIDMICAKSFKALEATTQAELDAVGLSVATNNACMKVLLSTASTTITDLAALGTQVGIPNGTSAVALTGALYTNLLNADPAYGDFLLQYIDQEIFYNETYFLPESSEKLEYIQTSIAEITDRDPQTLTAADQQNLMLLQLSLEVQQGTVAKFTNTIAKLNTLANFTSIASGVAYIGQYLGAASAAPVVQPTQPQPTSPSTGTTGPETPAIPTQPEPEAPVVPEPQPAPTPVPDPTPAPTPAPTV